MFEGKGTSGPLLPFEADPLCKWICPTVSGATPRTLENARKLALKKWGEGILEGEGVSQVPSSPSFKFYRSRGLRDQNPVFQKHGKTPRGQRNWTKNAIRAPLPSTSRSISVEGEVSGSPDLSKARRCNTQDEAAARGRGCEKGRGFPQPLLPFFKFYRSRRPPERQNPVGAPSLPSRFGYPTASGRMKARGSAPSFPGATGRCKACRPEAHGASFGGGLQHPSLLLEAEVALPDQRLLRAPWLPGRPSSP